MRPYFCIKSILFFIVIRTMSLNTTLDTKVDHLGNLIREIKNLSDIFTHITFAIYTIKLVNG